MATVLGQLETQFFAFIQARGRSSVETGELVTAFGWSPTQERKLLSRLSRKGLVTRVRRGLYLIPPRLPPGGRWSPGEYQALAALMKDQEGGYQICGPNPSPGTAGPSRFQTASTPTITGSPGIARSAP